jgi:hypothetical protein
LFFSSSLTHLCSDREREREREPERERERTQIKLDMKKETLPLIPQKFKESLGVILKNYMPKKLKIQKTMDRFLDTCALPKLNREVSKHELAYKK